MAEGGCVAGKRAWQGGVCAWQGGVCAWQGVCVAGGAGIHTPLPRRAPPPVERMTDTCRNITLPQTSFAGGKYSDNCTDFLK